MAIGNQKYLKPFNNYLNNKSGIGKTQVEIGKDSGGIITKNIKPQIPVKTFNNNKPAAGKLWTPLPMIQTPSAKQRNLDINKNIQNPALLKNKALNYGSLTHKLGLGANPPAINSNLGKPPTTKSMGQTIIGGNMSSNTGLVATTPGGIRGQVVTDKQGTPEFRYKASNRQTIVAPISGGTGPGDPQTFKGENGTVHTFEDEHFSGGGG